MREPFGSLDGRPPISIGQESATHGSPPIGRRRPSRVAIGSIGASIAGLALIAVVAGPWGPAGVPKSQARLPSSPVTASARPAGAQVPQPTLGPYGDAVSVAEHASELVARLRDVHGAGQAGPLPPVFLAGYAWPLHDARITNGFGAGRPGSFMEGDETFHDGLDISSFCGARVTAAHDGVILVAGRHAEGFLGWIGDLEPFREKLEAEGGWGGQAISVVVDDGNGYRSVYAHLGLATVDKGDVVRAGDLLGYEGASGNATGCHLHYAIYSPRERSTLTLDPKLARKAKLPGSEIARIDPLLVLPPLAAGDITWGWGAR